MKTTNIVTTEQAQKGFYPTPPELSDMLFAGIDWPYIDTILEPSAGKGNLVLAAAKKAIINKYGGYNNPKLDVDCIEIDPYLRSILQYEFGGPRKDEISAKLRVLKEKQEYDCTTHSRRVLSPEEKLEESELNHEYAARKAVSVHIVHDDFLTFDSRKHYDLIMMNPPFSDGAAHLLKAIATREKSGGKIRCILNAETISY